MFLKQKVVKNVLCGKGMGVGEEEPILTKFKIKIEKNENLIWAATWAFQQCGMCDQQSLRSACTVCLEPLLVAWLDYEC